MRKACAGKCAHCRPSRLPATSGVGKQAQRGSAVVLDLAHRALPRRLVRTPAQESGPMTKPPAGEVIVLDLDDELRRQWLPLRRTLGTPAAWPARRLAGEARFPNQL